ncbi:MAG: hypothetical protein HY787_11925 [Deltaproteobacteria bacterium]|nr:hypothetical protein [Deltaproteobacteria bacterium]
MSLEEYFSFAIYFGFLFLMIILAYQGTTAPGKFLDTRWGKSIRRNMSPKQLQRICTLLLIGGLFLLGMALWQLSDGTFKLKGNPKPYGFSDLLK